jgi:hypothetical protein
LLTLLSVFAPLGQLVAGLGAYFRNKRAPETHQASRLGIHPELFMRFRTPVLSTNQQWGAMLR